MSTGGTGRPESSTEERAGIVGTTPVVEVFADIWCPFAHVGLHRVVTRRARGPGPDFLIDVRAWPLELVNGMPLDPDTTAHHVRELRAQVAPDLFSHFDP